MLRPAKYEIKAQSKAVSKAERQNQAKQNLAHVTPMLLLCCCFARVPRVHWLALPCLGLPCPAQPCPTLHYPILWLHVFACVCMCVHVISCICMCLYASACVCMCLHVFSCICMCVCVCMCLHAFACVCICLHANTHMHM